ncbi:hypothetical protein HMPREF1141_3259 [Clostridium sp. MSTE9]|nr:hypothetical protein HMPREF1141_3259 [Clostridium sp. MSTE9]
MIMNRFWLVFHDFQIILLKIRLSSYKIISQYAIVLLPSSCKIFPLRLENDKNTKKAKFILLKKPVRRPLCFGLDSEIIGMN